MKLNPVLFLGCLVTLTSAFNLPGRSSDLSSRLAFLGTGARPAEQHSVLTLADRVAYQRAIEEVYWRHRVWPKERPDPKPSLDEVLPPEQLEKTVEDYLRNSQALEDYWKEPLSAEQLQAEMDRMAEHTKQPEVLRELFEALGNDPFVIAECLARPALSERLVTNLHAMQMKTGALRPKLAAAMTAGYTLPTISDGANGCTDDTWTATSTTNAPSVRELHTAVWTGSEMIVWGGGDDTCCVFNTGGRYSPSTDSWTGTSTVNAPSARIGHTAVWSGSEMIVWGGSDGSSDFNTGGRYNPGTDSWTATNTTNAPSGRVFHRAVWTGSEMIVWGGSYVNTGGRYNPGTDSWTATGTANAPSGRLEHTAVWTGNEMIIWGGYDGGNYLNTGGRYNPGTDSWTVTSTTNAPAARYLHTAIWSGSEMIVWGGAGVGGLLNTGGRYCAQSQAPMAQSAFSRKTHGAAGTFDVPLPLTGNVGIECRSGGATNDYQMIINFMNPVMVGSASVTSGTGSVSTFTVDGPQITVNLTGVTNVQRITVTLFNVNDGTHMGNVPVSMGVLIGDVNGKAVVNASDVSLTKSEVGQPVTSSNFREDVIANGAINAADVAQVKSDVGTALPP